MPRGFPVHRAIERRAWADSPFMPTLVAAVRAKRLAAQRRKDLQMKVEYANGFDGLEQLAEALASGPDGRLALISGLEPDEPVFVVRARDALALGFVTQYAAQAAIGGLFDAERSEALAAEIQRIVEWRRAHVERVRDPD